MRSADFIEPGDLRTDRPCYVLPPRTPMRSTDFIKLHTQDTGAPIYLVPTRIVFFEKMPNPSMSLLVLDGGIRIAVCEAPFEIQALIDAAAAGSD